MVQNRVPVRGLVNSAKSLRNLACKRVNLNHFVFYRNSSSCIILLVLYVDNIVITRSDSKGISSHKPFFKAHFIQRT